MVGRHDSAAGAPEQPREMTQPRIKLHYKVASSQLPAPQIAPRIKVVLQSRQFSSSSSPDTPRTKVVLQSRQFSSSSSPVTPRTKVGARLLAAAFALWCGSLQTVDDVVTRLKVVEGFRECLRCIW